MPSQVPLPGVWCLAAIIFDPVTDKVNFENQARYFHHLSTTGLAGLAILGTNAEAMLLTREKRKALIATARRAVGPSFQSWRGWVRTATRGHYLDFMSDATAASANSVLVLPNTYFGTQ